MHINNLITPGFMTVVEAIRIFAYFTFVYRLYRWGRRGKKETFVSAARRNAWAGGMLYRDSVSLTPLIQVFRGRPLALRPLNLLLYVR